MVWFMASAWFAAGWCGVTTVVHFMEGRRTWGFIMLACTLFDIVAGVILGGQL